MSKKKAARHRAKRAGDADVLEQTLRDLAEEITEGRGLAEVGRELLGSSSESVKARVFEIVANWKHGKPPGNHGNSGSPAVRIICDIPRPSYETNQEE